jgi:hypothetical protein
MGGTRGTTNGNVRGNSRERARRRQWLIDTFGDGRTAACCFCGTAVDVNTVSPDRFPVLGVDGGTYRRGNIRPSCLPCNVRHGARLGGQRYAEKCAAAKVETQ